MRKKNVNYVLQDSFDILISGDTDEIYMDIYYNTWYIFYIDKSVQFVRSYIMPFTCNYLPETS